MKRHTHVTAVCLALLLTTYLGLTGFRLPGPAKQSNPPDQYYPQTGHSVRDPFITYFLETGGVAQYGYPITDEYVDPTTRLLVQYFQKARLEWHPGNDDPYKVQLGLVGSDMGLQQAPIPISQIPASNDPNCQYFSETGHSTCFGFRDYWLQQGGLDRFGYPISEFTSVNGLLVQYFQRAIMEWHPRPDSGSHIQLPALGLMYYNFAGFDPSRLGPSDINAHPTEVTTLHARASVFKPVTKADSAQTAFVFVTDQFGRPLSDVAVTLIVYFPQGAQSFTLPPTNAAGTSFQTFALTQVAAGAIVPMVFVMSYPGLADALTRTSCMIWY